MWLENSLQRLIVSLNGSLDKINVVHFSLKPTMILEQHQDQVFGNKEDVLVSKFILSVFGALLPLNGLRELTEGT